MSIELLIEAFVWRCFKKMVFLKGLRISQYLCRSRFLIKSQGESLELFLKRDSGTSVLLWVLKNFEKHLFWRTPINGLFFSLLKFSWITDTQLLVNDVPEKSLTVLSNLKWSEFLFKFLFLTDQRKFPVMNYAQFKLIRVRDSNPLK